MCSPEFFEVQKRQRNEDMLGSYPVEAALSTVWLPTIYNLSHISVSWHECITEFCKPKPSVSILIVPLKEQINFFLGRNNSQMINKSLIQLRKSQAASAKLIEDFECVKHIEVSMHYELNFRLFQQPFLINQLHKGAKHILSYLIWNKWFVHVFHKCRLLFLAIQTKGFL